MHVGSIAFIEVTENVKELWRKAMNYTRAMARHVATGRPVVSLEVLQERQDLCAVCPERARDKCSACGCPLEAKLPLGQEKCPRGKW
ncbi:unnamed protein product [Gemmata massiliana]|uniref:Uncharacterized protein n=1 Tax=Gemmata massiliana TaxID=1210884 RepID=A0A6P2CZE9_9BACT|nr:hypothetical protein [Gemmata massiliana]VTR94361.1 unnamed protein product [Gemmata massiliana]